MTLQPQHKICWHHKLHRWDQSLRTVPYAMHNPTRDAKGPCSLRRSLSRALSACAAPHTQRQRQPAVQQAIQVTAALRAPSSFLLVGTRPLSGAKRSGVSCFSRHHRGHDLLGLFCGRLSELSCRSWASACLCMAAVPQGETRVQCGQA